MAKKKIYILKAGAGTVSTLGANTQQNFTGDGSTVAFTLSAAPSNSVANVTINGLVQTKTTDYSISSTTLTFVAAPANADKVQVFYSAPAVGAGDALTTNPLSQFAATTSAQLRGVLSDETGSGAAVFATSPTLVTPALGTPSAVVLTNATAVPAGQITGVIPIANLATGTPTGSKFIRDDGTLQAIAGGGDALTTNPLSQFAATTSLQLKGVISDETGSGALVFATSPTLVTPALGTPSAVVLTNATAVPSGQIVGVVPIANLATGTPNGAKYIRDDGTLQTPAGTGDVVGPASATADNIAVFNGTSGKLVKDSGIVALQSVSTSAGSGDSGKLAVLNGSGVFDTSFLATTTVAKGGTGATTLAAHGVVIGNGTSAVAVTGAGTSGQVLTSNGASADPTFQTVAGTGTVTHSVGALTAKALVVGNGSADIDVLSSLGTSGQVLTSNGAGALPTWQAAGAGSADMLSVLTSAEIAVTGAVTATISRMHLCTGTSANYTVTLPAASGNAGKFIGFRMGTTSTLTKLVTLDGNASETINGATTRPMWSNESVVIMCDGSNWFRIGGPCGIPMVCQMSPSANATNVPTATDYKVLIDTTNRDNTTRMADTSNHLITIQRAGDYLVTAYSRFLLSSNSTRVISFAFLNGTSGAGYLHQSETSGLTGAYVGLAIPSVGTYAAGDTLDLRARHAAVIDQQLLGSGTTGDSFISVVEQIAW